MTGWILYDRDNISRNRFFIERWMDAAQKKSIRLKLIRSQEVAYGFKDGKAFVRHAGDDGFINFVIMRAQHPLLSAHLEGMGIPCFNNAKVAAICNDKQKTFQLFSDSLPMMDTAFLEPDTFKNPFPYPVVVKSAHGCGGRQVYLAKNEEEYIQAVSQICPDRIIVQQVCDEPGKDLRVYVLGNKTIAGMLRYSPQDFRSNVGLGGYSKPVEIDSTIKKYVQKVISQFQFGLVGIDFIFHQGRPVFNEIEDAVGTRMLYMHTKMDIAQEYLDYILDSVRL